MIKQIKYDIQLYFNDSYYQKMCLTMFGLGVFITFLTTSAKEQYTFLQTTIFQNFEYSFLLDYFIIILPLIVSIPVVNVVRADQKTGMILLLRSTRRINYYISKIITAFIFGFLLSAIFLFSMIFLTGIYFIGTNITYSDFYHLTAGNSHTIKSSIFFINLYTLHPILFTIVASFIISVFAGCYATISLMMTLLVKNNNIIPYISVFVFEIIDLYFCELFLSRNYHLLAILHPTSSACEYSLIIMIGYIIVFIFFVIGSFIYLYNGDIYE